MQSCALEDAPKGPTTKSLHDKIKHEAYVIDDEHLQRDQDLTGKEAKDYQWINRTQLARVLREKSLERMPWLLQLEPGPLWRAPVAKMY